MARRSPRQRGLFGGYAPEARDPRGRKAIAWDRQVAEIVVSLAALQRTREQISGEVGLSVKTLGRIYADELSDAAERIRQAVFQSQLARATEKGSTPAAKFVLAQLERQELEEGVVRPRRRAAEPKLGIKDQRQAAAADLVDGMYAPRPAPERAH